MQTDRLALPLLAAAQAQKELTHNEALALLDAAVQPVVVAVAPASVPSSPSTGECWIVGVGATGEWAGQDGNLAVWTAGGWRFVASFEGMAAWSVADAGLARRTGAGWDVGTITGHVVRIDGDRVIGAREPAIADPGGGSTVDVEARAAIAGLLNALRTHGLIAA